jgi:GTPase
LGITPLIGPEKTIIVGLVLPDTPRTTVEEHLEELANLVEASGGVAVARVTQERHSPDSSTYVGKGKAEELERLAKSQGATLIVFDDDLSPAQVKNLEKIVAGAKVIDRSALILDIFARRARTRESQTQVELAQLNYLLPRLTRQWSHLSRQAGGIGTRGVGETQLELDRRMVRTRIARLKEDLARIEQNRETQRKARREVFTVALVGYTNAGKSTLFNTLTSGHAEAVDKVFATLDAKSQKLKAEMPRETVVIDTVGFIRKLPHHLVASFRSTMEEAAAADLVLHVINLKHPQVEEQREVGQRVLEDLGIREDRVIEVYNKADRTEPAAFLPDRSDRSVVVSALTGKNISQLIEIIRERELAGGRMMHLDIPLREAKLIATLHEHAQVYESSADEHSMHFTAWIPDDQIWHYGEYEAKQPRLAATN